MSLKVYNFTKFLYVCFKTKYRYDINTIRPDISDNSVKYIPFHFTIKLPPPCYERLILERNQQGRILHSTAPINKD